jgi:hypothetical protein
LLQREELGLDGDEMEETHQHSALSDEKTSTQRPSQQCVSTTPGQELVRKRQPNDRAPATAAIVTVSSRKHEAKRDRSTPSPSQHVLANTIDKSPLLADASSKKAKQGEAGHEMELHDSEETTLSRADDLPTRRDQYQTSPFRSAANQFMAGLRPQSQTLSETNATGSEPLPQTQDFLTLLCAMRQHEERPIEKASQEGFPAGGAQEEPHAEMLPSQPASENFADGNFADGNGSESLPHTDDFRQFLGLPSSQQNNLHFHASQSLSDTCSSANASEPLPQTPHFRQLLLGLPQDEQDASNRKTGSLLNHVRGVAEQHQDEDISFKTLGSEERDGSPGVEFSIETTLLPVSTSRKVLPNGDTVHVCRRTLKYLNAMALGIEIVSSTVSTEGRPAKVWGDAHLFASVRDMLGSGIPNPLYDWLRSTEWWGTNTSPCHCSQSHGIKARNGSVRPRLDGFKIAVLSLDGGTRRQTDERLKGTKIAVNDLIDAEALSNYPKLFHDLTKEDVSPP